ncbi:MAG: hypothetical protein JO202_09740 [Ktedonobacteraceae bacterium]|nr:hypothetical protein [Ktedonobacteraceae bacterium]
MSDGNKGQLDDLDFRSEWNYPFGEDNAIEEVDGQGSVDTEELKDSGYVADLKPIPKLRNLVVDFLKKWYQWYEKWGVKLLPPIKDNL